MLTPSLQCSARKALTLLELLVVMAILSLVLGLLLVAVQRVRAVAAKVTCASNIRQLGLALHSYHGDRGQFPPGTAHPLMPTPIYGPDTDPYPLLNWSARILPYLEQDTRWRLIVEAYRLDPHILHSPPHVVFYDRLEIFLCPAEPTRTHSWKPELALGLTSYVGVAGLGRDRNDGVLYLDSATRFADVTDGTSHTLFVGERPAYGPRRIGRWHGGWGTWHTGDGYLGVRDIGYISEGCTTPIPFQPDRLDATCSAIHFWSLHPGGGHFLFVDGSVRFLAYSADPLLPALASRNRGEVTGEIP